MNISYFVKVFCSLIFAHRQLCNLQLAKLAGNKVVATCGGSDKAMLLKKLGVDRVINYREEDVKTVSFGGFFFWIRAYMNGLVRDLLATT